MSMQTFLTFNIKPAKLQRFFGPDLPSPSAEILKHHQIPGSLLYRRHVSGGMGLDCFDFHDHLYVVQFGWNIL